jgi:lysozyme family protein
MLLSLALLLAAPVQASPCGAGVECVADLGEVVAAGTSKPVKTAPVSHRPTDDERMQAVYDNAAGRIKDMGWLLRSYHQSDMKAFYANYVKNKARYEAVAAKTGVPAELIAALHWRESTGDFSKYLHQGDPLGKKAVHVPSNIPIFHEWEKAAEHALLMKKSIRDKLSITATTTDPAALATFAEYYNGLGYYFKGKPSPYVFSGTDQYTSGKYIRDRVYSSKVRDRQLGVMAMIQYIRAREGRAMADGKIPKVPDLGATASTSGPLKRGSEGDRVKKLQQQLKALGYYSGPIDGDFGRGTVKAVKAFQNAQKITADGQVGAGTQGKIDAAIKAREDGYGP